jgi:hypothetical protein
VAIKSRPHTTQRKFDRLAVELMKWVYTSIM